MSWLKDILEENRRVVDLWPAWKKGAAMTHDENKHAIFTEWNGALKKLDDDTRRNMTRKEELSQRAKETTEQLLAEGVCLSNGECEITDRVILQALKQVEREVWNSAKSKALSMVDYAGDDYKLKVYADWCDEQQKELG